MCLKLDTELLQGLENVLETSDLAQMQKPQPVNPELPSWPVSGFLHMLNNFRGKSQPFGDQDYISLELLGNNPSFIFILFLFFFFFGYEGGA